VGCAIAVIAPLVLAITLFFLFSLFTTGPGALSNKGGSDLAGSSISADRKSIIEETFDFAWDGYFKIAFPHDELKPVSEEAGFSRNDWGATAVDALGTAILMEKRDVVHTILEHVQTINFSKTDWSISVFETTIRYMGGMLSAYDLLTGPFSHLVVDPNLVRSLLHQSIALGEILSTAFLRGNALPHPRLTANAEAVQGDENSLAGVGTLVSAFKCILEPSPDPALQVLEWSRLSDLTGNKVFETLSRAAEGFLLIPMPKDSEALPGLVGTKINVETGLFADRKGGWGGSCDSFYEYLIKMYLYDPKTFGLYKDRWILAANSSMLHLASSPRGLPNVTFLGKFSGTRSLPESGHMECFAGGNFLLGGQILAEQRYTDFGLVSTIAQHERVSLALADI
jgi:mannosyl-oligosaccharide alpha-1,2-mannosidase